MYRFLLTAARLCLVAFLLGGAAVTLGQLAAITLGDGRVMELFGTTVADVACTTAAVAGVFAFLLRYTRRGKEIDDNGEET
ncbi:hypothetical protein [Amycolatopsis sp. YIM 10]|uniref:hypothetical protein n=1 Tax=Amycolatopsis sp. YIM 10 TaxID=2653857 RepID=UPI00129065C0|nr:hypothetical protein [Amycolatopsis sp. YIM 10]QFU88439.1 hypothetical protein YIM_16295 [Amycolatopsis sp. YIM 10]